MFAWKAARQATSNNKADNGDEAEDSDYDCIVVRIPSPPLPLHVVEDSDSDDVDIILNAGIEATTRHIYNIQNAPFGQEIDNEEETQIQTENRDLRGFLGPPIPRLQGGEDLEVDMSSSPILARLSQRASRRAAPTTP